ncbi:hypothetical protein [Rhizobium sp. PP-CC-3G-465]|uniref:hypothetical protein n=1 Tax=Rhizobium sp. PP-CC-3G-465 TaxID=2135648 RepID=UPI0010470DF7|nr:hypothetical protein C8J33_1361 [Rhizobium sp. PP-CC-3G-465]
MTHHIFFSWQSDTPNGVGRSLIETCLERAIGVLQADADVDLADRDIVVDRDTLDVPGSPPIMETIFGKIDRAAVFLSISPMWRSALAVEEHRTPMSASSTAGL